MKPVVIDDLIAKIRHCVETHLLDDDGRYARWLWGEGRNLGLNEYGVADAANILYTIGDFPSDPEKRAKWVKTLQGMQDPKTGMFAEPTHHTFHTTAHCIASLELFDAKPLYPCYDLQPYTTKEGLYDLLENHVDWEDSPWTASHKGAGIFVSLTLNDMVGLEWKNWYFDWMWEHADPESGFFFCGKQKNAPLSHYMAGGFHYMFNHEADRRPLRYPERTIDSCLSLMQEAFTKTQAVEASETFGDPVNTNSGMLKKCNFIDVDVIYGLTRSMRKTPYRFEDGKKALEEYAERYLEMMNSIDVETNDDFNDLHLLFGAVCALAELQTALPGKILTSRPLRLVLDRRPFI